MDICTKNTKKNTFIENLLNIKSLTYQEQIASNVASEYLMIQTSTYFPMEQYKIGDTIKLQNYVYRETGVYTETIDFNNFMNRDSGHTIISINTSDPSKLLKNTSLGGVPCVPFREVKTLYSSG